MGATLFESEKCITEVLSMDFERFGTLLAFSFYEFFVCIINTCSIAPLCSFSFLQPYCFHILLFTFGGATSHLFFFLFFFFFLNLCLWSMHSIIRRQTCMTTYNSLHYPFMAPYRGFCFMALLGHLNCLIFIRPYHHMYCSLLAPGSLSCYRYTSLISRDMSSLLWLPSTFL
jgi:hypothetical protein